MDAIVTLRKETPRIFRDSNAAFENAVTQGMKNPSDWMYMGSQESVLEDGVMVDAFKNIRTRSYTNYRMGV